MRLGATSPAKGVYWLPEDKLEEWGRVAGVVEASGYTSNYSVYTIRNVMDADAVRAVRDAVVSEIASDTTRLEEEINDTDHPLGERALESRKRELLDLRTKIREYEALLGVGLTDLSTAVERVEMAAAEVALTLTSV